MNFLAHIYLSGDNEDIQFGNFIGDWVKGKSYHTFPIEIQKGILLHRKIDSYTDSHETVKKSIHRLRPAYGKYAGIVTDILYDHFLSRNWIKYSNTNLTDFVSEFHKLIFNYFDTIPKPAKSFISPFIRKNRLLCYTDINCFEDVLKKMAIYTSMPNRIKPAMVIIKTYYSEFENEFNQFFPKLIEYSKKELLNQSMPKSNPKGQSD